MTPEERQNLRQHAKVVVSSRPALSYSGWVAIVLELMNDLEAAEERIAELEVQLARV